MEYPKENGVHLAYYDDFSGMAVFNDEIEALRYAVEHSMKVKWMVCGKDLREQVNQLERG